MADFETAIAYVLDNEKGFSNRASDKGGATNWGVTQKLWEAWVARSVTVDEMKALTVDQVKPFYLSEFWNKMRLSELNDQVIATIIMDQGVNEGIGEAGVLAQRACGFVHTDGIIGGQTIMKINGIPPKEFFSAFFVAVQERYIDIVLGDIKELPNLKGWLHRSQKMISLL